MSVLSAADAVPVSLCELSMPQASSVVHIQDFLGHHHHQQQQQQQPLLSSAPPQQQPPGNNNNVSSLGTILASSHELLAKSLLLSGIELGDVANGLANGFSAETAHSAKMRARQNHTPALRYESSVLGDDCTTAFETSPNAMHLSAKMPHPRSPREDILNLSGQNSEPKRSPEGNTDNAKVRYSRSTVYAAKRKAS
jgi:hypothetical protein